MPSKLAAAASPLPFHRLWNAFLTARVMVALALLTLPGATAGLVTRRLDRMMALASLLVLVVTVGGLAASYGPGWPTGATIVELAAALYVVVAVVTGFRRRFRGHGGRGPA